jgi:lipopolysaccharide/colanic/teichoic acid biosynthesis glycosyltransferase
MEVRSSGVTADDLISDFDWLVNREIETKPLFTEDSIGGSRLFWASKRAMDILSALAALPFVAIVATVIAILNPIFNPGRLLFRQERMGMHGKPFTAYKFRSMTEVHSIDRGPYDGIESERITRLGSLLRRLRIDELPQFWNILRGDMSLIGPRPDYYPHAVVYCHDIPNYTNRHLVRPGITGLAQVRSGYAACARSVAAKVSDDLNYISEANWKLELRIARNTIGVILSGFGHK